MKPSSHGRRDFLKTVLYSGAFRYLHLQRIPSQRFGAGAVPWIDVHVHLVPAQRRDFTGAVSAALDAMDQSGIRKMIVLPMPQNEAPSFDCDDFVAAIKPYPMRFAFLGGGGTLNIRLQQAASQTVVSDALTRQFEQRANDILREGAAGFGEMAAHHLSHAPGHPYESVPADHPLLLLLADIAARNDVPIDLHFDVAAEDMRTPGWLTTPPNPQVFHANVPAFERLLSHNTKARIVWAHAGSDMLGQWTASLSRKLLGDHSNLYMSLRLFPGQAPQNFPLLPIGGIKPEWLSLLHDFSSRFVIGGDQFITSRAGQRGGPAAMFSQQAPMTRQRTQAFLNSLPADLARKIGFENAMSIYPKIAG
jgi:predicted TIM-barrel fold metal-dependent hydrolase